MEVVHRHSHAETKEQRALAAALLHDLGHGPFSHAFEAVGKRLGLKLANHETMSDELIRTGEVADVLNSMGSGFATDVADIIKKDGVKLVQHAVVSSQFDADRLDYIRRDRMMTGSQHSAIDFTWLIANLEVASVPVGVDEQQTGTVETFVLGPKAVYAAEAYVLGLFQLYPTVYFHKATRGAEKIFVELLVRIVELARADKSDATGLPTNHPLIKFGLDPENIEIALSLDDTVVAGALGMMVDASDGLVAKFAKRLRDRKLYGCIDIRSQVSHALDPKCENTDEVILDVDRCCAGIHTKLEELATAKLSEIPRLLTDNEKRSPYKSMGESKGPLDQINVRTDGKVLVDLKERSRVVAALKTFKLLRVYTDRDDTEMISSVQAIVEQEIKHVSTER
jgi:HD superfamily phosphohydrolase